MRIEAQADETVMTDFVNGVKVSPSPYGRVDSVESEIIPVDESRHVFKAI